MVSLLILNEIVRSWNKYPKDEHGTKHGAKAAGKAGYKTKKQTQTQEFDCKNNEELGGIGAFTAYVGNVVK